jgi:hypothetical protein
LQVSFVFSAASLDELRVAAVERELHELSYKKVRDWFAYLVDLVNLNCPSDDEIEKLAEIKATRDVFVHGREFAGPIYEERAGVKKRCKAGEKLDIPEHYHRESWNLIRRVVTDVSVAAAKKA